MRSIIVIVLAFAASACSYLEQLDFNAPSIDPTKIYLSQESVVSVSSREAHRYACVAPPLLCVQRGVTFECRCP